MVHDWRGLLGAWLRGLHGAWKEGATGRAERARGRGAAGKCFCGGNL